MKKIATVLLAGGALALAGTAALAAADMHHMTVREPDGTTLQVEYTGNIAPEIEFGSGPATMAAFNPFFASMGFMSVAAAPDSNFLRIEAMMDRQMQLMQRQIRSAMTRMPAMNATFGAAPGADNGWSFASLGKGAHFCSRSVAVTVVNGKRHVEEHSAGDCGSGAPAADRVTGGTGPKLKI